MIPGKRKSLEKAQDKSRKKILSAAFELFAQKGYTQTSVDSIAVKAKVSKGLIYHYFDSKELILKGVFAHMKQEGDVLYKGMETLSPEQFLGKMIDLSLKYVVRQTKTFRLMIALTVQSEVMKGLKKEIELLRSEWLLSLANVFKSLNYENPETEAYLFTAQLDGIGIAYIVMGPDYPLKKIQHLIESRYGLTKNNVSIK